MDTWVIFPISTYWWLHNMPPFGRECPFDGGRACNTI